MGKLIILSGPSCVGKGPLVDTLNLYYKSVGLLEPHKHVLYTSRAMRPGEENGKTYHFWSKAEQDVAAAKNSKCMTFSVHADQQMINFETLENELNMYDVVLVEIFINQVSAVLNECKKYKITAKQIFVSPLSKNDFKAIQGLYKNKNGREIALIAAMITKLANRGTETTAKQIKRSMNAPVEMQSAIASGAEIVCNHFGEDNKRLWKLLQEFIREPGSLEITKTFIEFLEVVER